ncbi:MAG: ABC transporter permease [Acidimicrobiales bacterium]
MRATLALARVQLKIIAHDPWFLIIMFGMPLVVMPLFQKVIGSSLAGSGFPDATGAELVVPGQMVLFGFFVGGSVGFAVYREHGWRTWDRLRSSAASPHSLLAGFAIPWIVIHILYSLALLMVGGLVIGLRLNGGSPLAVLLMLVAYACCVVALILLATATFRTVNQLNALQNVGAMVFGGLGGALVPFEQLPGWAQAVAPATPAYWAMKGHRSIFLEQGSLADVLAPAGVLLGASVVLGGLGVARFRVDETKEFFA